MPMMKQPVHADGEQRRRNEPPEPTQWEHLTDRQRERERTTDRQRVAQRERTERAPHRAPVTLLQRSPDGEQPAHRRVDAVRRAEGEQREPGNRRGAHDHSA